MNYSEEEFEEIARAYIRYETDLTINSFEVTARKSSNRGSDYVASVVDSEDTDWWLIGGSTPITLCLKSEFPKTTSAYDFHIRTVNHILNPDISGEIGDAYYHVFISYSTDDSEFVEELVANLEEYGLRIWWDSAELLVGENTNAAIGRGQANSAWGVGVITENSLNASWPEDERGGFMVRENTSDEIALLPIYYDIELSKVRDKKPNLAIKNGIKTDEGEASKAAADLFDTIKRQAKSAAKGEVNRSGGSTSESESLIDDFLTDYQSHYVNSSALDLENRSEEEVKQFVKEVDESDRFERVNDLDNPRKFLNSNDRVIVQGSLQRTPLSEFIQVVDENDMWDRVVEDAPNEQVIINQFESASGYFELDLGPDCQIIMRLSDKDIAQNHNHIGNIRFSERSITYTWTAKRNHI